MDRRNFLTRLLKAAGGAAACLAGLAGSGYLYTKTDKFGAPPMPELQAQYASLPYWKPSAFRNTHVPTYQNMDTGRTNMVSLLLGTGDRRPPAPLPVEARPFADLGAGDALVWFGHSTFFMQLDGVRILTDPVFSDHASPIPFTVRAFDGANAFGVDDFPRIDMVCITHDHWDHLDHKTILALRDRVRAFVCPLGVGAHLRMWGIPEVNIYELQWHQTMSLEGIAITCTPGHHFSGRTFVRNTTLWGGFVFGGARHKVFCSGDTGHASHLDEIGREYGPFDFAMLDCGQYNPKWRQVHMTPEDTADAAVRVRCKTLVPAHIGKFALSIHSWRDPFDRIVKASEGKAYQLCTPMIGELLAMDNSVPERYWWR